jgi:cobalt-zinc-cadmium efflux system outer membrane protein
MRAVADVDRARAAVGRECAGRVPDVELEAGVRYNLGSDSTLATMGFALPLQLFDRNQGNIYRAQAELAAAHHELRRVELLLQERLAQEFRRYDDARETVAQYRDALLPDASDALQLARAGYQQGEFNYLEVLTVQRTYFATNLAFVDAVREARISRVRIEGLLLTGGLESPGPIE